MSSHDGWIWLGGRLTAPPAVASWAPNRLDVFGLGEDRDTYEKTWTRKHWLPS